MRKRGQEEMVGFVMVVIVMAIVFLVFIGIMIRQPADNVGGESTDIYQFLESSMQTTSDCALSYEPNFLEVGELLKECYEGGSRCVSEETPCDVLGSTMDEILEVGYLVGPERPFKGYEFKAVYSRNVTDDVREVIVEKGEGECLGTFRSAEYLISSYPGTIVSSFKLCS
ncbi:hypothetical protein CMI47_22130 [Candidatus Pacearchaeota archaeon]|nr:hypothetical protein [Candidatus Pacearchaeota archaeon]